MTSRRSFLAVIATLPFVRNLLPRTLVVKDGMNVHVKELAHYDTVILADGGTIWFDKASIPTFTLKSASPVAQEGSPSYTISGKDFEPAKHT